MSAGRSDKDVWLRFTPAAEPLDHERLLEALLGASCPYPAAVRLIDVFDSGGVIAERPVSPNVNLDCLHETLEGCGVKVTVMKGHTRLVQIDTDSKTVWINTPDGMNIGRFGPRAIDIHHDIDAQIDEQKHCLSCRQRSADLDSDWSFFQEGMRTYHRVDVSDRFKPEA